jgi:non-homologous end joining protein Ku
MITHSIWKWTISFGLVSFPIEVDATSDNSKDCSISQLDDKGHRIKW